VPYFYSLWLSLVFVFVLLPRTNDELNRVSDVTISAEVVTKLYKASSLMLSDTNFFLDGFISIGYIVESGVEHHIPIKPSFPLETHVKVKR